MSSNQLPTRRELEILDLVAEGLNGREITKKLWISDNTLKSHLRSLFKKTGAHNQANLIHQAWLRGWFKKKEGSYGGE